jgi:hypothetical protein
MNKHGKLLRASYRSFGQQLQQDILSVEFEVDGEIHEHPYPNIGWDYNNPALLFLGFLDKKPTDFDGCTFEIGGIYVPVQWVGGEHGYLIDNGVLQQGKAFLKNADWFDPDGEVYNNEGQGSGGMNVEPGTGNQGSVEIDGGN